ncbi:MAG: tetratricopeptide repeat protein, partial [Acidobacteria bacterium]|nr:tetratricopeptide repeat protein [Acidobacteriota bacterium]
TPRGADCTEAPSPSLRYHRPMETENQPDFFEIGDFQVDARRRRLLNQGEVVSLPSKAFDLLLVFLESHGEVLRKEALLERLWPETFVSEGNLSQNVFLLRKALGDSAGDHHFIVTVPRQGYRFVATVQERFRSTPDEGRPQVPMLVPEPVPLVLPRFASQLPVETRPILVGRRRIPRRKAAPWLLLIAGLVSVVVLTVLLQGRPEPRPTEAASANPRMIVVAVPNFRSQTARPESEWLRTGLAEMMQTELTVGPRFRPLPRDQVQAVLQDHERSGPALWLRLRQTLAVDWTVEGTFVHLESPEGNRVRLDIAVLAGPDGEEICRLTEGGLESELLELVSRLNARLRRSLDIGEPSAEEARQGRRLRVKDFEALRLYSEGLDLLRRYRYGAASELLSQASALEPSSPLIHSALALAKAGLGFDRDAGEEAKRAHDLAADLAPRERLWIEAQWRESTQQWEEAATLLKSLLAFYPDDLEAGLRLAAALRQQGKGHEALSEVENLQSLPPPLGEDPRIQLEKALALKALSRPEDGLEAARAARRQAERAGRSIVHAMALTEEAVALADLGHPDESLARYGEAETIFRRIGDPLQVAVVLSSRAVVLHRRGSFKEARQLYRQALEVFEGIGHRRGVASQLTNLGMLEKDVGHLTEARELFEGADVRFQEIGDEQRRALALSGLGSTFWRLGDIEKARQAHEESLELSRRTGNQGDLLGALNNLAILDMEEGKLGSANESFRRMLEVLGHRQGNLVAAAAKVNSGEVLLRMGDSRSAQPLLEEGHALLIELGRPVEAQETLLGLARLHLEQGRTEEVANTLDEILRQLERGQAQSLHASALLLRAELRWERDELTAAREDLALVLEILARGVDERRLSPAHLLEARLLLSSGRYEEAAASAKKAAQSASQEEEILAWGIEALALWAGQHRQATRTLALRLENRSKSTEARLASLRVGGILSLLKAARGELARAETDLEMVLLEADRAGLRRIELEARLAQGLLLRTTGRDDIGRLRLHSVATEAESLGLLRLSKLGADLEAASLSAVADRFPTPRSAIH